MTKQIKQTKQEHEVTLSSVLAVASEAGTASASSTIKMSDAEQTLRNNVKAAKDLIIASGEKQSGSLSGYAIDFANKIVTRHNKSVDGIMPRFALATLGMVATLILSGKIEEAQWLFNVPRASKRGAKKSMEDVTTSIDSL